MYDCGDHWAHRIRIGRIQPARDDRRYQYFVSGAGPCPLEDIGDVWGHDEFMRAFDDPNSDYREYLPDLYKERKIWDPEDADLDARRARLAPFAEQGRRASVTEMSFLGRRRNLDCENWSKPRLNRKETSSWGSESPKCGWKVARHAEGPGRAAHCEAQRRTLN